MKEIQQKLQQLLDSGFCHDSLKGIEKESGSKSLLLSSSFDGIYLFVLNDICFSICEILDNGPITADRHNKIEELVLHDLENVIDKLTSDNMQEKIDSLCGLLTSYKSCRKV